jgi:uncharacterized protein
MGAARPYGGAFHGWTYEPVNETDRAAREILARLGVEVPEAKPKRKPRAKTSL